MVLQPEAPIGYIIEDHDLENAGPRRIRHGTR